MSVPKPESQMSFTSVPFLADPLIESGSPYRLLHGKILPMLQKMRPELARLHCADNGRPGIEPIVMAGVTLVQFVAKVPDRVAVQRLKLNIGWKYAPGTGCVLRGADGGIGAVHQLPDPPLRRHVRCGC